MSSHTQRSIHRRPPGPKTLWPWGDALAIQHDALNFAQHQWEHYGDVVRLRVLQQPATMLVHPEHVQDVLQRHHQNFDKNMVLMKAIGSLLGQGLFTNNGKSWLHQRRLIQKQFHHEMIASFGGVVSRCTNELLERWNGSQDAPVEIVDQMAHLSLYITASALFSTESSQESASVRRAFATVWSPFSRYVTFPIPPISVPIPRNISIQRATHQLDSVIYRMISQHRRNMPEKPDLLSLLLQATDQETGEHMTDRQVRDELVTMFVAGHETTAFTLAWVWYVLSQFPEVEERVCSEVERVTGGNQPSVEHLSDLQYTRQVVEETLRLYPASFAIARRAIDEDVIGGYYIPANSIVFLNPFFTQRHPAFWPDPLHFDPERFIPSEVAKRHRFAYFPFGGGPRICIGNAFALMEIPLVVATIVQRFRLRLVLGHKVEPWVSLTMRPRYGLPMYLQHR